MAQTDSTFSGCGILFEGQQPQNWKLYHGTSLVVQWLGLWASTTAGTGFIPGQGTGIPHAASWSQKISKQANKTPPQFTTTRTFHTTQSDRPHKARWPSRVQSWEVSGESWGSQPTPTIPVQQENVKQTHEEMTFDTKRRPCYCRWRIARVHFHFIFLWNLNGITCSRIWVVLVSHWWRFLMICNSTFDDLNFLQWNCQKKSKM